MTATKTSNTDVTMAGRELGEKLESRMIRKRQVRFGGGPLEKYTMERTMGQLAGGLPYVRRVGAR